MLIPSILVATLLSAPLPEIYVYVENDPQIESQHVIDALETPIKQLYSRLPSEANADYLDWLMDERDALWAAAKLISVKRRDEANVPSYIDLPAWSFSPREIDLHKFNTGVYCHLPAVCMHLTYLAHIYRLGLEEDATRVWPLGLNMLQAHRWFKIEYTGRIETRNISGHPVDIQVSRQQLKLKYEPYPPIDLSEMPWTDRSSWQTVIDKTVIAGEEAVGFNVSADYLHDVLDQCDFGSGVISHPKVEKKPEKDEAKEIMP